MTVPPALSPRALALEGHMDAVTDSHGPIWHGTTVLIVDNESVMRSLVRRALEAKDFGSKGRTSGNQRD